MTEAYCLEKKLKLNLPSAITNFKTKHSEQQQLNLFIKRDEQIDAVISGNKWRKLKYNLLQILDDDVKQIISFGGAWSNHLHALSQCCKQLNIELIAMIRGEPGRFPSSMISDIVDWGTTIEWLSREQYRKKNEPSWLLQLQQKYPQAKIIPEGGSNQLALKGVKELAAEIIHQLPAGIDYVCAAVGSGGTLAGLIQGFESSKTHVVGIPVLKGKQALEDRIILLLDDREYSNWQLKEGYECGGYAKYDSSVADYIVDFKLQNQILLEPIYTAKLLMAVEDLIKQQYFKSGSTVVVLHSGGIQGLRGDNKYSLNGLINS